MKAGGQRPTVSVVSVVSAEQLSKILEDRYQHPNRYRDSSPSTQELRHMLDARYLYCVGLPR